MDFDNDGVQDIISGSWPGEIYLFRGLGDGSFADRVAIKDAQGKPLKPAYATVAFAADWDADGDIDLVVGTFEGEVSLYANQGADGKMAFGEPQKLTAAGKTIQAPEGDSGPAVADWDSDGKLDLVVGCGDGGVVWCRNIGTRERPELAAAATLVPPPEMGSPRGAYAKVCITDWNGDGRLDLLVGDRGSSFEKALSEEEEKWRGEARKHQAELLTRWTAAFARYRELLARSAPTDQQKRAEHGRTLASVRAEMISLKNVRDKFYEEEQALKPGRQYHGRVWLYLRASRP